MADSSSDESNVELNNWVFYKDRVEWADVKPTPQDDGPYAVVQIAYSEKFSDVFDYFRTVMRTNEISQRALDLIVDAAKLNPANYTVWHYRRILLKELKKDLIEELNYVADMIRAHPKTYQLWHHRSAIVDWLKDGKDELAFTESILEIDSKNYHAWQHRQWSIRTFGLWDKELQFVDQLLQEDVRNNSAWNQRYFVINSTSKFSEEVLDREVKYTLNCIKKAPHNESSWNYLSGILFYTEMSQHPGVREFVDTMYNAGGRSPYLLSFIVDMCENELELGCDPDHHATVLQRCIDLCSSLAKEHDTIRKEYWKYMARCYALKFGKTKVSAAGDS